MKNIVLSGGGTAGHIMPNIALLPELKKHFDNIYYIGEAGSLEERIAGLNGIPFYPAEAVKLDRSRLLSNIKIPFVLLKGIASARKILKALNPAVLFCKGGYVSLPAAYAARSLKIPVICHESDTTMGVANKLIACFADAVFLTHKDTPCRGNAIYTGLPVRKEILNGDASRVKTALKLPAGSVVLVMGGSLGSQAINKALNDAAQELFKRYNIVHITGNNETGIRHPRYRAVKFADNIGDYMALADIVVSRAGATACAELNAIKKRMLLIPLPKGASRGDQELNARAYEKAGAARLLPQSELSAGSLIKAIDALFSLEMPNSTIKTASNAEIAGLIAKYGGR